jgi:hypothetical protein
MLPNLNALLRRVSVDSSWNRRIEPQCLIDDTIQMFQPLECLDREFIITIYAASSATSRRPFPCEVAADEERTSAHSSNSTHSKIDDQATIEHVADIFADVLGIEMQQVRGWIFCVLLYREKTYRHKEAFVMCK